MVRIHFPPAESLSLSPSCCRGSRIPAFPGGVSLEETRERDVLAMSWLALVDFL